MGKSIGGVALPDGDSQGVIEWIDRHTSYQIAQQQRTTLGGAVVLFQAPLVGGREVTLVARDGVCWLPAATVSAVLALAAVESATYSLVYDAITITVAFRHHQPPAVSFDELFPGAGQFTGEIRLITVEA